MHAETAARPLILVIDPDRRRTAQLDSALRARFQADLTIAESAEAGVNALAGRLPALILTSALLSPKDDMAIARWLRGLGQEAAHVQTLAIPLFAQPSAPADAPGRAGVLSSFRRERQAPTEEGCAPDVFVEQVALYLERVPASKPSQAGPASAPTADSEEEIVPIDIGPDRPWERLDLSAPHIQRLMERLGELVALGMPATW
jgi:hypothetical protein